MNLTDRNIGRIPQTLRMRENTITAADVRAYRVRNPLYVGTDADIRQHVLAEHPCDLGFISRSAGGAS